MATLSDIINEVQSNLSGYTFQQDRATHLLAAVSTTTSTIDAPTTLSLASTDNVGKGLIEIDDELMWVDSYDRVGNLANISPFGRGYMGTVGATHARGAKVTIAPTFPRSTIKRGINDTIRSLGATIFAVKTTTFDYTPAVNTYAFNDLNIKNILTVSYQNVGPSQEWVPVRRWSFDSLADSDTFGSGAQTITLGEQLLPGRTVKVVYATDPSAFTADTDVYTDVTGLPESTRDVVVLGTAYRLLAYLDPARASQTSPQADETDSKRPYGASQTATKQLYALYTQRLNEETRAQQQNYPPRVHFSRR